MKSRFQYDYDTGRILCDGVPAKLNEEILFQLRKMESEKNEAEAAASQSRELAHGLRNAFARFLSMVEDAGSLHDLPLDRGCTTATEAIDGYDRETAATPADYTKGLSARLAEAEKELTAWRSGGVTDEILRRHNGCIKVNRGVSMVRTEDADAFFSSEKANAQMRAFIHEFVRRARQHLTGQAGYAMPTEDLVADAEAALTVRPTLSGYAARAGISAVLDEIERCASTDTALLLVKKARDAMREIAEPPGASCGVAAEILAERERQKSAEGYGEHQDDGYLGGQLALAAATYTLAHQTGIHCSPENRATHMRDHIDKLWPWEPAYLKVEYGRRDLIKAAALITAEVERFDRAAAKAKGGVS